MIKFRNCYNDDTELIYSDPGSRIEPVYELKPDAVNDWDIQKSNFPNDIQDRINSFRDSVDINILIARFQSGDIAAIPTADDVRQIDISNIPDNYQDLHKAINFGTDIYESLPENIKADYSSVDDFLANFDISKYITKDVAETESVSVEPATEG